MEQHPFLPPFYRFQFHPTPPVTPIAHSFTQLDSLSYLHVAHCIVIVFCRTSRRHTLIHFLCSSAYRLNYETQHSLFNFHLPPHVPHTHTSTRRTIASLSYCIYHSPSSTIRPSIQAFSPSALHLHQIISLSTFPFFLFRRNKSRNLYSSPLYHFLT